MTSHMTPQLERWRKATDGPLLMLSIASIPLLVAELLAGGLNYHDQRVLTVVNVVLAAAFLTDLVAEMAATRGLWPTYVRHEWLTVVVAIAQAAAVFPSLTAVGLLRSVRVIRPVVAGVRLIAVSANASRATSALRRRAASLALSAAALTWLTSAMAFVVLEDQDLEGDVTIADGLWWSLSTITTVGYGDIYPTTPAGRVVAGITMLVGISTFAIVTARVAEILGRQRQPRSDS